MNKFKQPAHDLKNRPVPAENPKKAQTFPGES